MKRDYEECKCVWDESGHVKIIGRDCYADDIGFLYISPAGYSFAMKHPSSKPVERKERERHTHIRK